jgi:hypothetical protein
MGMYAVTSRKTTLELSNKKKLDEIDMTGNTYKGKGDGDIKQESIVSELYIKQILTQNTRSFSVFHYWYIEDFVRFQALTAASMKIKAFWDMAM